jgi:hypothetical protein
VRRDVHPVPSGSAAFERVRLAGFGVLAAAVE